ncbi:MAG: M28 family peptidase [Thermoanaerobaculia bacterium]
MLRFKKGLLLLALALAACAPAPEEAGPGDAAAVPPLTLELPAGHQQAATEITADYQRQIIATLADDGLEGRGPGTAGDAGARRYLIEQLQALGLEPGGPGGSWEQSFEIVGTDAKAPDAWTFRAAGKELSLKFWDEFIASSGVQEEASVIDDAELVFVGYGIEAPEYQWDDYKDTHLEGKVLLMLNNDPDWDPSLFDGNRRLYYGRWTYKYESAARHGAAGAIIIHTDASAGYPWQVVQTSWTGPQFELPAGDEPRTQVHGWVTWEATEKLVELAGHRLDELAEAARHRDFQPMPLGIRTSLRLDNDVSRGVETANVLGLIRGSDPELADQVVIYTAHHDHLGRGKANAEGDDIYNGARDNGSGCAVVMSIARAWAALPEPPRRSVLFAFVAAEEQGLLGSKFYARQPTVHPGRLAANVNFDSANIWGRTRDLTYIGYGKSTLDRVADAAAATQGRTVQGDQFPDKGYFYRSDQFSLAKIGVPAMYFSGGTDFRDREPGWGKQQVHDWTAVHYHQQSDELTDEWNFAGMVEDARLGFVAGLHVAQADDIPAWNVGDEFEAARLAALAELGGS